MNNSKIVLDNLDEPESKLEFLEKQKGELTQVVEAINRVEASDDWQKLKRLVFEGLVPSLERLIINEASKKEIDAPEMYRLQGQLTWANKYADLRKLADQKRLQIENIKNQLHEQTPRDGAL